MFAGKLLLILACPIAAVRLLPVFTFSGESLQPSLAQWTRIDDVIMGGISSSRLVGAPDGSSALFEGKLRERGGGFCGQRMQLLSEPLDLSASDGMYLDLEADAGALSRVFKMAIRTRQDRGEVVYQASFTPPPLTRTRIILPFSDFRLVRGPRLVPGVPPLRSANASAVFQLSVIVSKFTISETGAPLPGFREGPFRVKLYSVGAFREAAAPEAELAVPAAMTKAEAEASRPLLRLLGPLLGLLFSEPRRRRATAAKMLQERGSGPLARARLGWALRRAGGRNSLLRATGKTLVLATQDAAALVLSAPLRILAAVVFRCIRAVRRLRKPRGLLEEARRAQPQL